MEAMSQKFRDFGGEVYVEAAEVTGKH